jgi:hypothetical protein
LHDPRVRGAASPLVVALSIGMIPWAIPAISVGLYFEAPNQPATALSAIDILILANYVLLVAVTTVATLLGLARAYERKYLSDIQLAHIAFWLLTTLAVFGAGALASAATSVGLLLGQVGALSTWTLSVMFIGRTWRRRILRAAPPPAGSLLILRVFKRPARSEEFLDRLLSFWRFAAAVHFIAGPDLAGASIEPDEFFAFMRGRLGDRFVRTPSDVSVRVDGLDRERDPDGRFRINELFCMEDAWRAAVGALMAQASVVLLDLREYKVTRAGTRYEIYQLMNLVSVDRIIVLLDGRDDADAISTELHQAWSSMSESSPNRRLAQPALRVCRLRSGSAAEVKALFMRMYALSMSTSDSQISVSPC